MFYCFDCGNEFENPKKIYETHNVQSEPFEKILVCPVCSSTKFKEKITTHCRCCGARLPKGNKEYCSERCHTKGEYLRSKEIKRKKTAERNPINTILKELNIYNTLNRTNYSYGQYVAIIKPKLEGKPKKCAKKKSNI